MKNNFLPIDSYSDEALFRYQVVSRVRVRELNGQPRSQAVCAVADEQHFSADGQLRKVSKRNLYRWLKAFETQQFMGLLPKKRKTTQGSVVLDQRLLEFFKDQKQQDPIVSVPELIRRAKQLGIIKPDDVINRVTAWRSLKRMGLDTTRCKTSKLQQQRRFAYPHRMDMVLCDGKHFRAGPTRLRRVALFFLDDATRFGLNVVVGTSENTELFVQGLYETINNYGLMTAMFVDNGPGFVSTDTINVAGKLGIFLIHGTPAYPQGHGKIERFNATAFNQVIRFFDNNPEIDPDCAALQLRLRHYLFEQYDQNEHESLEMMTPWQRFHDDQRVLRFHENKNQLQQAFILHHKRRVSNDNIVSFRNVKFEVALGNCGRHIILHHNLIKDTVSIMDQGRFVRLKPVDLHQNARLKRSKPKSRKDDGTTLPKGSAQMAFERDMQPIVDHDGGFSFSDKEDK